MDELLTKVPGKSTLGSGYWTKAWTALGTPILALKYDLEKWFKKLPNMVSVF